MNKPTPGYQNDPRHFVSGSANAISPSGLIDPQLSVEKDDLAPARAIIFSAVVGGVCWACAIFIGLLIYRQFFE